MRIARPPRARLRHRAANGYHRSYGSAKLFADRSVDGKAEQIVGCETIGGIDLDFAAAESVGHFERREVDGGASVGGNRYGLDRGGLAVHDQRHRALAAGVP